MKLLVINTPIGHDDVRRPGKQRLFPWGLAHVVSALENDGHEVEVLDIWGRDLIRSEVEDILNQSVFDVACVSAFASVSYWYVLWLSGQLRKRFDKPIVVGGMMADLHYDLLLEKNLADVCVIGEGEITAVDLFRNFQQPENVQGIAYRKDGRVHVNGARPLIGDPDDLPMANFDMWPMELYTRARMYAPGPYSLRIHPADKRVRDSIDDVLATCRIGQERRIVY